MHQITAMFKVTGWALAVALIAPLSVTQLVPANLQLGSVLAAPAATQATKQLANQATNDKAASLLRAKLDAMQSLQGQFTQTLTGADGELQDESAGDFKLARPGKFYWHTKSPMAQLLISDGATIWLYDPDLETVNQRPFTDDLRQTPALLLSEDAASLSENFAITNRSLDAGGQEFTLVPHETEGLFAKLVLAFKSGELAEFVIEDTMGQVTRCALSNVQRNPSLSADTFKFVIPEGAEVIQN